jgi:hypothetical protein
MIARCWNRSMRERMRDTAFHSCMRDELASRTPDLSRRSMRLLRSLFAQTYIADYFAEECLRTRFTVASRPDRTEAETIRMARRECRQAFLAADEVRDSVIGRLLNVEIEEPGGSRSSDLQRPRLEDAIEGMIEGAPHPGQGGQAGQTQD